VSGAVTGALNADLGARALARTGSMDWAASPAAGVWRKRLYHVGPAESGRVTSIVRFDPGSRFPRHDHPEGEEILVLAGTFSDETGDWGAGSWLLSPDGSPHAPHTADGCTLFVHLRQYRGPERRRVDTHRHPWAPGRRPGVSEIVLLEEPAGSDGPLTIRLVRLAPGTAIPAHDHPLGEESYLIEGDVTDDAGAYGPGCWLRQPPGSRHAAHTDAGALLYVRTGGLGLAHDG